ncbi:hypothetical protein LCGC14_2194280 [marine sediment metagenome]|uniref:Uncharacterized protein n=1 Tax=marine sediment metagenome TaxID=412755 RepID=A0A0F9DIR7_9ZZZZ
MSAECDECGTDLRFRGDGWPQEMFCQPCELAAENERLNKKLTETQTLRVNDILHLQRERDAAIERGVLVWRQTIRQRRALMLALKLIGIEHAQDHEALEETLAEVERLRAALRWST